MEVDTKNTSDTAPSPGTDTISAKNAVANDAPISNEQVNGVLVAEKEKSGEPASSVPRKRKILEEEGILEAEKNKKPRIEESDAPSPPKRPMIYMAKCEPKTTRVGPQYQTNIPEINKKSGAGIQRRFDKNLLWRPSEDLSENEVNDYLHWVNGLFSKVRTDGTLESPTWGNHMCPERSLYFLMRMDYDIEAAQSLLTMEDVAEEALEGSTEDSDVEEGDVCNICGDGGNLLLCDAPSCPRLHHLHCVHMAKLPEGDWECPSHYCVMCEGKAGEKFRCNYCFTSYCEKHVPLIVQQYEAIDFEPLCEQCLERKVPPEERFMERLREFHRRRNTPLTQNLPRIGKHDICLFRLQKGVIELGGAANIIKNGGEGWNVVRRRLRMPSAVKNIDISKTLKVLYMKIGYPYERKYFQGSQVVDDDEFASDDIYV